MHLAQCMSFVIGRRFERANALIDFGFARRLGAFLRLPLMERKAETIQLRLEARQTLFETRIVLIHRVRLDDTTKRIAPNAGDARLTIAGNDLR